MSDRQQRDELMALLRRSLNHDIRSPLAVIVGRCDLLLAGELSSESQRSVEAIARNAQRMKQMIEMLGDAVVAAQGVNVDGCE